MFKCHDFGSQCKNANVNATFAVKFKKSCRIEHDFKQSLSYQVCDDFHICAVDSM